MFKKASKKQSKLRLAVSGVSGAGKTYTALRIASGMSKKIALIDTEYGSASKYGDIFSFDTLDLKVATIDKYIGAIKEAGSLGYEVLIIDSLSHAWDFLLEEVDKIAKSKYNGNSFRAWSEGTPMQKNFINAILSSPCHIIATMRVKTEYVVESNSKGKMAPRKVGLSPRQREGLEYEFDMLMEGNHEHYFHISKDRTSKFQDKIIEKPDEKFGKELIDWLNTGEDEVAIKKELLIEERTILIDKIMKATKEKDIMPIDLLKDLCDGAKTPVLSFDDIKTEAQVKWVSAQLTKRMQDVVPVVEPVEVVPEPKEAF